MGLIDKVEVKLDSWTWHDETVHIQNWIKKYFVENGPDSKAIIGISGGKDSTIVAALCAAALGRDKVLGVLMPQGEQHDLETAIEVCEWLGIDYITINIGEICNACYEAIDENTGYTGLNSQVTTNTPARIRMAILYAIAAMEGGRVANTCNTSENYIGYSTKFGDGAGDFAPIHDYTVSELMEIGKELQIPDKFLYKTPEDGLSGLSDEDNLGFTYKQLDDYLLYNIVPEYDTLKNIEERHERNRHKNIYLPHCYNKHRKQRNFNF